MTEKNCISCGMPMRSAADHALGDASKNYCHHCANAAGELKSYEEALVGMSGFLRQTQGLDEQAALQAAKSMMAKMPAWKDHGAAE
jgi:hypothetical protein